MSITYDTLYQDEERAVEITIRNQDDDDFIPSSAYAAIYDDDDGEVKAEQPCMSVDNKIYIMVDSTVTAIPGKYKIIWRIMKIVGSLTYKFFHKTELTIKEL